jgi:cytochrome P450
VTAVSDHPTVPAPTRVQRRAAVGERLLDSLEAIIARHRSTAASEPAELHAELIAAEVAHQLALTRAELRRLPFLQAEE